MIHEDIAGGYFDGDTNLDVSPNPPLWMTPSNAPAIIGNQFVLTNTAPWSAQFYKLRRD